MSKEKSGPGTSIPSAESVAARGAALSREARNSCTVETLARGGLAARGITYLIIASIAVQIAIGHGSHSADQNGAVQDVASQPFGRVLLGALALGFAAYALWRWSVAAVGSPGDRTKSAFTRVGRRLVSLATGVVYTSLCITTIRVVAGGSAPSTTRQQQSTTAWLLGLPLGRPLVIAIGVGVALGGGVLIARGASQRFAKNLHTEKMGRRMRCWATGLGMAGYGGVGTVVVLVGIFLVKAAAANDAGGSKGLDQTLRAVSAGPFGKVVLVVVTVGLAAYGVYSLVEARFLRV